MAETHSEVATNNDDLFGESPNATSTATLDQDPGEETSGEEVEVAADEPETEVESEEAEGQEADSTPPEASAEVLKILLKKGISEEKFNEYLKRYDVTAQEVNEKPKLAQLLLDKAASDELIAKAPKEEVKKEEVKQDTPVDLDAHFKTVLERANSYTDPKVMDYAVAKLEAAKDTREQLTMLMGFMENYVQTVFSKKLPDAWQGYQSEQQKAYDESMNAHSTAWAPLAAENPNLNKDAVAAFEEAKKLNPTLVNKQNLTPAERMEIVALVLGGRKADAEAVAQAAEKGKEAGAKAERKAGLGKLGAGQSTGAIAKKTTGNDDIFGAPGEVVINQRLVGKKT